MIALSASHAVHHWKKQRSLQGYDLILAQVTARLSHGRALGRLSDETEFNSALLEIGLDLSKEVDSCSRGSCTGA
jgi:hypothetical protein